MRPNAKLHNWKKSFALATLFVAPIMLLMSCLPMIPARETIVPAETSTKSIPASPSATPTARDFDRHTGCGGVDELGHIFFFKPSYYGNRRHASNFDLYVMNGNGCFPRLVMKRVSGSPAWSRDGTRLAVGCENNTLLCILDVKATLSQCSGTEEAEGSCEPAVLQKFELPPEIGNENFFNNIAWSKDGDKIAAEAKNKNRKYSLSILFLNDDNHWTTLHHEYGADIADWSPQQDLLATGGIYLVNPNNGQKWRIFERGMSPVWSVDGKRIAFVKDVKEEEEEDREPRGIAMTTVSGESWQWLSMPAKYDAYYFSAQNLFIADGDNHRLLSWSPDEKYIAFIAIYRSLYDSKLFRLNIESGKIDLLVDGSDSFYAPAWGP